MLEDNICTYLNEPHLSAIKIQPRWSKSILVNKFNYNLIHCTYPIKQFPECKCFLLSEADTGKPMVVTETPRV